jgi:pectate lyase
MGGQALIEGNYFYNSVNPITSRSSKELGFWDLRNNNIKSPADFSLFKITWTNSSGIWKNADTWITTKIFPALPYEYTLDQAEKLDCITRVTAGAGKGLKVSGEEICIGK